MKRLVVGISLGLFLAIFFYSPAIAQESDWVKQGAVLYKQYCAACHGLDAKGAGPAAPALKAAPTDLTMIQKKGEPFPTLSVRNMISGEKVVPSHGSREMPVWGEYFEKTEPGRKQLRILSLTRYLESIQMNK